MNPEDIKYLGPNSAAMLNLLEAASQADVEGRSLRILFEGDTLRVKVGEGCWSPPYAVHNETNRPY